MCNTIGGEDADATGGLGMFGNRITADMGIACNGLMCSAILADTDADMGAGAVAISETFEPVVRSRTFEA